MVPESLGSLLHSHQDSSVYPVAQVFTMSIFGRVPLTCRSGDTSCFPCFSQPLEGIATPSQISRPNNHSHFHGQLASPPALTRLLPPLLPEMLLSFEAYYFASSCSFFHPARLSSSIFLAPRLQPLIIFRQISHSPFPAEHANPPFLTSLKVIASAGLSSPSTWTFTWNLLPTAVVVFLRSIRVSHHSASLLWR